MQTIVDIIKVVAVFAVIFGPAVGKIYNSMKKRAAEREQEAQRRRIRDEAIRTGRLQPGHSGFDTMTGTAGSTPQPRQTGPEVDAKRRLQEMAQRRRAEVQAQQRSSSRPAAPPMASSRPPASPGAPAADRRTTAQQRKAAQQEQQRRKAAAQLAQRQQQEAQRRQQQQQQSRRAAAAAVPAERDAYEVAPGHHMHSRADEGESVVHRLTTDAPIDARTGADAPAEALRSLLVGPMARLRAGENAAGVGVDPAVTRAAFGDLRRAILLREILDRPVSMREPREIEGRMSV